MGPQRRLGIYVGFDSPSIIRYLEPLIGDILKTRFDVCHFNETIVLPLGGEKSLPEVQREKVIPPLKEEKLVPEERREMS